MHKVTDGSAIISGKFTLEYAKNLAALIQSGALPVQLEEIAIKNVGATLGSGSLEKTIVAGAVAFGIILLFMAIIYGLSGLMADLALVVYMVLMIIALYVFNVTLTLPGIAGIILSLGMAVDANVVIFERIKEELAAGRSVANAVEKGFKNAFSAVIDANITTLIAVIVLAIFGTGNSSGICNNTWHWYCSFTFDRSCVCSFIPQMACKYECKEYCNPQKEERGGLG